MSASAVADAYGLADDPSWEDVRWEDHERSVRVRGARVAYVDLGPTDPDAPAAAPLVLLHGFGGCWQNWLPTIPPLARSRRVIGVDLPGFGASALPRDLPTPAAFARVVEALCEELDLGPVVLAGNSLGGLVATIVAGRFPDRVERLALLAPVGGAHIARVALEAGPKILGMQLDPLLRRTPLRSREHPLATLVHDPAALSPRLMRAALLPGAGKPGVPLAALGIGLQGVRHANLDGLLRRITAPTLLIWGLGDRLLPSRTAETFTRGIADARLVVLDDTGHVPQLERPRTVNRLLRQFADGS